jgi:predicted transcriptional regulator
MMFAVTEKAAGIIKDFLEKQHGIRVRGLNEVLASLYAEGRETNEETAEEIIDRLGAKKNYIPSSDRARKEYAYVLLKEYRTYVKGRTNSNR